MRQRTKAREYALQLLYQIDLTGALPDDAIQAFWQQHLAAEEVRAFAELLVRGTTTNRSAIDVSIARYAEHWQIQRMAAVDRNVLRLGAYELLYCQDIPPKVTINEAVELAKRYGDLESSRFVNGVLDQIHKQDGSSASAAGSAS